MCIYIESAVEKTARGKFAFQSIIKMHRALCCCAVVVSYFAQIDLMMHGLYEIAMHAIAN